MAQRGASRIEGLSTVGVGKDAAPTGPKNLCTMPGNRLSTGSGRGVKTFEGALGNLQESQR